MKPLLIALTLFTFSFAFFPTPVHAEKNSAKAKTSFTAADQLNIDRLKEIVNINSGSANIKGVTAVQEKLKLWFEELGFKVELKPNPKGESVSGPLLLATLAGEKPETITFIMHSDTVFEPSSPFQIVDMKNDHLMHGPGVIDDKGGIIVALQALKDYLGPNVGQPDSVKSETMKSDSTKKIPKYTLQVEVTPNEEVGATGWDDAFKDMSKHSFMALGLEPANKDGIVEGRKGNIWFLIEVKGKEAHAGVDHQSGVNACDILAGKIHEIQKLTDYAKNVTVSVGHMEGGQDKYNIVCGWAKAKLDTRFPNLASRNELKKKIERILDDPRITVSITDETPALATTEISKSYIKKYVEIIAKIDGKRPLAYVTGGVGDINHFSRDGIILIDGLGPVGEAMHTPEEYIDLRSIPKRAKALTQFLEGL